MRTLRNPILLVVILLLASVVVWNAIKQYVTKRSQSVFKTALEQEDFFFKK